MKSVTSLFRIATLTLAIAAGQQATAAAYIKFDGIKGESRNAVPTTAGRSSGGYHHGGGGGAGKANLQQQPGARGSLDRNIIRPQSATSTTPLPQVGTTNLHGIEPDEID